jgi:mannose-6-phosphate isomerase-like protein (cupin superfamily)
MPIFRQGEAPPKWCEMEAFDIVAMVPGETVAQRRRSPKERLIVAAGNLQLRLTSASLVLRDGQFFDLVDDGWEIRPGARGATFVRLSGRWGNELGGCGVFSAANQDRPVNAGDPVAYAKTTSIDSHYHDCDEYWIVLEGQGTVVVGDRHMIVAAGDCVPIGMGHHHDMPSVDSPVQAVYFETTLAGEKRTGHLWNHTHGRARPKAERI